MSERAGYPLHRPALGIDDDFRYLVAKLDFGGALGSIYPWSEALPLSTGGMQDDVGTSGTVDVEPALFLNFSGVPDPAFPYVVLVRTRFFDTREFCWIVVTQFNPDND